jgi:Domain of unknown function (DUF6894)
MARYFFQANYHGVTVVDEIGEDFPTVQEAEAHAVAVAKELGHNNPQPATVRTAAKSPSQPCEDLSKDSF